MATELLNVCEGEVSVPVVAFIAENGQPNVIPCYNLKNANTEAYYRKWSQNQAAESYDLSVRFDAIFPNCELYTIFSSETFDCLGLFRTKEEAEDTNRKWHRDDHRKFTVLRIDFNK